MSLIIPDLVTVTAPTYFKIELGKNITDKSGNPIDLSSAGLLFIFTDNYANVYKCIHNPFDPGASLNTFYDENEGLTLLFQNYKLRDRIKLKMGVITLDSVYDEGESKAWDGCEQINLIISWK